LILTILNIKVAPSAFASAGLKDCGLGEELLEGIVYHLKNKLHFDLEKYNIFSNCLIGFCRVKPESQELTETVVRDVAVRNRKFSLNPEFLHGNLQQS
jgi:hypothetical protein